MTFTEKIDVIDMIIDVWQDHEKKFDELENRLEQLVNRLSHIMEKYATRQA